MTVNVALDIEDAILLAVIARREGKTVEEVASFIVQKWFYNPKSSVVFFGKKGFITLRPPKLEEAK